MKKTRYSMILLSIAVFLFTVGAFGGEAFASVTGRDVAREAMRYEGNRVVMDSAESVQYIYGKLGFRLPGTLDALSRQGTFIQKGQTLHLGDIVFFGTSSSNLTAAGIYVGSNRFIISHRPYSTIRVMSLSSTEPSRYYLGARRIVQAGTSRVSSVRERIIQEGLKYLGTPYQYNSNRSSTRTFDCSDFVRRVYYDATGYWLPSNSRTQASFVRQYGRVIRSWSSLKRGDLIFFSEPNTTRISHVAIYMGDGRILHTTRNRGVHVASLSSYWLTRADFGGNLLD